MDVRINHNPRNPISARVHEKVGSFLTLDFEQPNGNNISIMLPPHMGAVVHLIADLFNSHIGQQVTAIAASKIEVGDPVSLVPFPTGSGISTQAAVAIATLIVAEPEYTLGDVNGRGQVLVRISDETASWLDRGKAWVTATQAERAHAHGWVTNFIMADGAVCISR